MRVQSYKTVRRGTKGRHSKSSEELSAFEPGLVRERCDGCALLGRVALYDYCTLSATDEVGTLARDSLCTRLGEVLDDLGILLERLDFVCGARR